MTRPVDPATGRNCHPTPRKFGAKRGRNPSPRLLSAELEIASFDSPENASEVDSACRTWGASVVEDGSLPDTGCEINTAPAAGIYWCDQVAHICEAVNSAGAEVTADCGLHVHIDARDYTYWDVRRLILAYAKIEDALFGMVPNSRRKSHYCKPCADHYLAGLDDPAKTREQIAHNVYGQKDTRNVKQTKYHGARYRALNLHSWFLRGTVECRLAAGSTDARKITLWGILWAGILDYASRATEKQIAALPSNPIDALLAIAPTAEVREFIAERWNKFNPSNPVSAEQPLCAAK